LQYVKGGGGASYFPMSAITDRLYARNQFFVKRQNMVGFDLEHSLHVVPLSDPTSSSLQALGSEAGQGLTLSNSVSLLSHCRNSRPVTVRRKSGAPLAAYSTIPEGGHTTDTERQPCRVKAPISGACAGEASTPWCPSTATTTSSPTQRAPY